jgi:2-polyprenyl-3-methyl-5-hydroxy-6-metoxy-1,4-benzoquinol methylase
MYTEPNKLDEIASAEASKNESRASTKPFGSEWGSDYWGKWQTICYALYSLGIQKGATILDVGVGGGWTTLFLAECGFVATGVDIAPASIDIATRRAQRYQADATFIAADMDDLDLGTSFDAALVFDALHHTARQARVVHRIATHLAPGGWVLFGEPSWLHSISPHARRTTRELGWVERGIRVRSLKNDCRAAGLGDFRRFYEGSQPHSGRVRDFAYQAGRVVATSAASAPRASVWLAARRMPAS